LAICSSVHLFTFALFFGVQQNLEALVQNVGKEKEQDGGKPKEQEAENQTHKKFSSIEGLAVQGVSTPLVVAKHFQIPGLG